MVSLKSFRFLIIAWLVLESLVPSHAADLHLATMVQRINATIGSDDVFVKRVHTEVTVKTAAAAAGLSHFPVSWTGNQTLKIVKAYTRKADGRIIQTNPADLVMQNGLVGAAASFGDIKTEQLAFRDLAAGDTIVIDDVMTERTHYVPGVTSEAVQFGPNDLDVSLTYALTTPKSLPIRHFENKFGYAKTV